MKLLRSFTSSISILFIAMASPVCAQDISFEAFKISDLMISATWENTEKNLLPAIMQKIESDLKAGSATEKSAKVFVDELGRVLSKDKFAQAFAHVLANKLSTDEQRQTLTFLQSSAGKKYMEISGGEGNEMYKALVPLIKQACDVAASKLGIFERGSLNGVCGKF